MAGSGGCRCECVVGLRRLGLGGGGVWDGGLMDVELASMQSCLETGCIAPLASQLTHAPSSALSPCAIVGSLVPADVWLGEPVTAHCSEDALAAKWKQHTFSLFRGDPCCFRGNGCCTLAVSAVFAHCRTYSHQKLPLREEVISATVLLCFACFCVWQAHTEMHTTQIHTMHHT